jgi:hypothetical protein
MAFYLVIDQALQQFDGQILLRQVANPCKEFVRQNGNIRFGQAGCREDIHYSLGSDGIRDDLAHSVVEVLSSALVPVFRRLDEAGPHCLEETHIIPDF